MYRTFKPIALVLVAVLMSSAAAWSQSAGGSGGAGGAAGSPSASTPGTNSAGTANSSGSVGTNTGAGLGNGDTAAMDGSPRTGDAKVDAQDKAVDRKVKSICKGC
jgi:hypothetical protein